VFGAAIKERHNIVLIVCSTYLPVYYMDLYFVFAKVVSRWEDNIKMDLQEVGGGDGDWMELAQDRDRWWARVSTAKNLRVP
jgi:hypothetical protein